MRSRFHSVFPPIGNGGGSDCTVERRISSTSSTCSTKGLRASASACCSVALIEKMLAALLTTKQS